MTFIPNTFFGISYLLALIVAGAITFYGERTEQRRILWLLVCNFIITRAIVSLWPSQDWLWLANDYATSIALVLYGRTRAAKACAILFSIIAQFDLAMIVGWANFPAVAAISDFLGYLILLIMTGAAHDMGGHKLYSAISPSRRFFNWICVLDARRSISSYSRVPSRNDSKSHDLAEGH
jgi:hypothetical protein